MRDDIIKKLDQIEHDFAVTIIFACESGSRAWGFPSADSDYDVRFIYVHKASWYLSIMEKRDVIELPLEGLLDINGWDLRKALGLLRKSNPALLEWLNSPIVYKAREPLLKPLRDLAEKAFLPESSCHHYLSMAKSGMDGYRNREKVKLKTYLYSLRPLLCCRWVIDHMTQPPMLFEELLETYLPTGAIRSIVDELLRIKSSTNEKDRVEHNEMLERYIESEYWRLDDLIPKNPDKLPVGIFDETFKEILELLEDNGKSN